MKNPQAEKKDGTFITLVGGNNAKRIGGNSYVIEAQNEGKRRDYNICQSLKPF